MSSHRTNKCSQRGRMILLRLSPLPQMRTAVGLNLERPRGSFVKLARFSEMGLKAVDLDGALAAESVPTLDGTDRWRYLLIRPRLDFQPAGREHFC